MGSLGSGYKIFLLLDSGGLSRGPHYSVGLFEGACPTRNHTYPLGHPKNGPLPTFRTDVLIVQKTHTVSSS